jgi:hypothetical protein
MQEEDSNEHICATHPMLALSYCVSLCEFLLTIASCEPPEQTPPIAPTGTKGRDEADGRGKRRARCRRAEREGVH